MSSYLQKLADIIVSYSIKVEKRERVLIIYHSEVCEEFVKLLIDGVIKRGGIPMVKYMSNSINSKLLENLSDDMIELLASNKEYEVNTYDSVIQIIYNDNDYENKNVVPKMLNKLGDRTKDIDDIRINKRKWVLLNYPSKLDSYKAGQTT